jgi:hypothetical protein
MGPGRSLAGPAQSLPLWVRPDDKAYIPCSRFCVKPARDLNLQRRANTEVACGADRYVRRLAQYRDDALA